MCVTSSNLPADSRPQPWPVSPSLRTAATKSHGNANRSTRIYHRLLGTIAMRRCDFTLIILPPTRPPSCLPTQDSCCCNRQVTPRYVRRGPTYLHRGGPCAAGRAVSDMRALCVEVSPPQSAAHRPRKATNSICGRRGHAPLLLPRDAAAAPRLFSRLGRSAE
eukprot:scaffold1798_cov376-Prasinococcus_capsulatus_cf.AAC.9